MRSLLLACDGAPGAEEPVETGYLLTRGNTSLLAFDRTGQSQRVAPTIGAGFAL